MTHLSGDAFQWKFWWKAHYTCGNTAAWVQNWLPYSAGSFLRFLNPKTNEFHTTFERFSICQIIEPWIYQHLQHFLAQCQNKAGRKFPQSSYPRHPNRQAIGTAAGFCLLCRKPKITLTHPTLPLVGGLNGPVPDTSTMPRWFPASPAVGADEADTQEINCKLYANRHRRSLLSLRFRSVLLAHFKPLPSTAGKLYTPPERNRKDTRFPLSISLLQRISHARRRICRWHIVRCICRMKIIIFIIRVV